ncbi:SP family arabinose:H+ symporter-like MFS transporter [Dinghuibacter silviterrae]|uniref:SP family arabinose:H+ symporter-like MFS transporter n=2 Tax=Dinghuibacter silviterrae TaxID=1539049 RepID=A0A4R8DF50_9BACT|nr:SP family arabinose:H+ symporter-like MFS transporter [Dinghuibacter silviterrae]
MITVSGVAALGGLLFGFDTAVISGAIPAITAYFKLDGNALGWAVGAVLIGCAVGALFAGRLADALGRRFMLIVCAFLFAASGIGAGLSGSLPVFIAFRLAGGLGVGAAAMVSPMYIAEISPAAWRGRLVSLYQLAIVLGILGAYFSNYTLAGIGRDDWRLMFASQAAPSALFAVLLCFVPETPRWLAAKGKKTHALLVLGKINGLVDAPALLEQIDRSFEGQQIGVAEVWKKSYRPAMITGILLAVFQQVTGINAIIYYAPVIFQHIGGNMASPLLQTIAIGVVNVLATCVAIGLVDKWGRRQLLVAGCVLMGLMLTALGLCFRFGYFGHYLVLIFMLLYVAAFGCTLGAVVWVYLSEMFPNRIRGMALSIATLALWVADFAVTYSFPVMTERLGTASIFFVYAAFCLIAFLFILVKVPETKGRSLEEAEALFE